jgi:hypothetical protein
MIVIDQIKGFFSGISLTGVTHWAMIAIITVLILLIVAGGFALWAYSYIMKKKFNITIQLFEKVNGKYRPTKKVKAMELNYSDSGEKAIFIKELKRYRAKPTAQMGERVYWLALDNENSLVNIEMQDVDFVLREMKVETTETESRANRIAFQKALGDRMKKKESFWDKYGKTVMNIIFIILVTLAIAYLLAKVGNMLGTINDILTKLGALQEKQGQILTALDNIVGRLPKLG